MSQTRKNEPHLSEDDFNTLAETWQLGGAAQDHLDACTWCQEIAEKTRTFDPERGARELIRAVRNAQSSRRRPVNDILTALLILVTIIGGFGIAAGVIRVNGLTRIMKFEVQRTEAAEQALSRVCKDYLTLRARAKNAGLETPPLITLEDGTAICQTE